MTKKFFRNSILFLTFVLGGIFLNSCSNFVSEKVDERSEEFKMPNIANVSFAISDAEVRTALPKSDEHDLKKYLYLYNYTLTYADGNDGSSTGERIICNDFSYDRFLAESNVLLAIGKEYKFTLKAKDGAVTRMIGSSTIVLSNQPSQTVTIVLVPAEDEMGQKLRVDWIVPDDGVITKMKAGISPKRGYAESQREDEILDPKYRFQEYSFSVLDNPDNNPHKAEYGDTIKRIGLTFDNVKTGVPRWLDYKFYDANGILVYESSESLYMIGGKTSSAVIYITPDYYYRRPVKIPVYKGGSPWTNNSELELKLVDKNGHEYVFKAVVAEDGKTLTGEFEGLLPGKSSGEGSAQATDGIFDIYVGVDGKGFIKTGAEYDANTGTVKGNGGAGIGSGKTDTVELVTVDVPQKGVTLTPAENGGVVGTDGTVGDGSGNGSLIVPAGQDFKVQVKIDLGYGAGGEITVGGKPVADGGTVTLNSKDLTGGISYTGIDPIVYSIVYKNEGTEISFSDPSTPRDFTIEREEIVLPNKDAVAAAGITKADHKYDGWYFGNKDDDNIIHRINAEKTLKEKLIRTAVNNTVDLNIYWIETGFVEYKLVYRFEKLNSSPAEYIPDETVVDKDGNKVVSFHYIKVRENVPITIPNDTIKIPEVPGFTHPASISIDVGTEDGTKEIDYTRNSVSITLDGNGGNWGDGKSTDSKTLEGKFGASHDHIADPVRVHYKFLGWYDKTDPSQTPIKHVDDHRFPAKSVDYAAKWEKTYANYKIEFYYETVDSTPANPRYERADGETKLAMGMIGTFPAFETTPKSGFTFNDGMRSITAGEGGENITVVRADDTTLVKLYFDRRTVSFTLKSHGGKFTDGNGNTTEEIFLEGKYGTALPSCDSRGFKVEIPQSPVLEGINDGTAMPNDYAFNAWHVRTETDLEPALPSVFPAENSIYAARWTQNNGIYKVVHWAESMDRYADGSYKLLAPKAIDGFSGQMLEGSVTKKGKIGSPMVYFHDSVTGFKTPTVEIRNSTGVITGNAGSGNISDNEKTEVIVTYLRKDYTITFHMNAGGDTNAKWYGVDAVHGSAETVTRTGKYRMDFDPPDNPVREHFIFRGWAKKVDGTLEDRVDIVPSYRDDSPAHYYAVWYSKASGGLEKDTSDIALSCSVNGTDLTANVAIPEGPGEWAYSWSVNNVPVSQTGKTLTLSGCLKKDYEITVVATHNGKVYTKTEVVTVR